MSADQQTPAYRIRPATNADRATLRTVNRQTWEAAYRSIYSADEIRNLFENRTENTATWFVRRQEMLGTLIAEVDGVVVGYVSYALMKNGTGEITHLYLLPEHQGRGIGRALWDAAITVLRETHGIATVWVWVLAKAAAYQFYLHMGGQPTEMGHFFVGRHTEPVIGLVFRFEDRPRVRYPAWMGRYIFGDGAAFPWEQGKPGTLTGFLRRYILYESSVIGLWLDATQDDVLLLEWELGLINRRRTRIDVPTGEPAYLAIQFAKIYQVITNDIETKTPVIDRVRVDPVTDLERQVWAQLITAQTLIDDETAGFIVDDDLYHTSIVGMDGDVTHIFHRAAVRFLCFDRDGRVVDIPEPLTNGDDTKSSGDLAN